ncbi:MAG: DinB family protein [Chloroflexi bacterium]|nr:DinB family protein [Chloroflexota bacterium]
MNKQEIEQELEKTHDGFIELVNSIPEENYSLPTDNPAWTVGDILFHITLGPRAVALEVWMIVHARGVFGFTMRHFPSRLFNSVNAWFGRGRDQRVSRRGLLKAYGRAHAVVKSRLRRTREEDLVKLVVYPPDFVSDLAGEVTPERLFRYVSRHFEMHEQALRRTSQVYRLGMNSGIISPRDWSYRR